jgi:3-oxosteroid 1-dehydrogenase
MSTEDFDFVCIGAGIGGLSGAITAAELGMRALVIESSDLLGGVAAYSAGQLWIAGNHVAAESGMIDSIDSGLCYLEALGAGQAVPELTKAFAAAAPEALLFMERRAGLRWQVIRGMPDYYFGVLPGARREGRSLEVQPFPAASLGEWRSRTRISPHYPYHATMAELVFGLHANDSALRAKALEAMERRAANDERCLGPGLGASLVKAAGDRDVAMWTSANVVELLRTGGRVTGVKVVVDGRQSTVHAARGVLLATGGYDWNPGLVSTLEHRAEWSSRAPASVTGAHLELAGALGARTASVPRYTVLGVQIPGKLDPDGNPFWVNFGQAKPHSMIVNRSGRRFADDSFYLAVSHALNVVDGSTMQTPNSPCWAVFDAAYRAKYPIGPIAAGAPMPEGLAETAPTLTSLAERIGVDAVGLEAEAARFNRFAQSGVDLDFGRGKNTFAVVTGADLRHTPNPSLGMVSTPPFHAIKLQPTLLSIASTGLVCDGRARVIGADDAPIPGLYAAGNSMALLELGAGYQSGIANSRGMAFAYLAARDAAAVAS